METLVHNETVENLLKELDLTYENVGEKISILIAADHRYIKDLKINVSNAMAAKTLTKKEVYLIGLAVSLNDKNILLQKSFERQAIREGANNQEIAEIVAMVSLMNVNNIYYRFRHFAEKDYYNTTPAGIKMSIMMNPVLGKEFFELGSLVLSALNGCEMCVVSHEEAVRKHGTSEERVLEAIKLGAVLKGLLVLL